MNTLKKNIYILLSLFAFSACADLDTFPESGYATEDQKNQAAESDPAKIEAGVNAIFTQFSTYMTVVTSASRHNDFGYGSLMLTFDTSGYDMISDNNGYNWMGRALTYEDRIYTSYDSSLIWGTLYNQIYAANNVLLTVDPETTDETAQFYLAQAYATRAFDYWVLAQLYQFNYVGHEDSPCVLLVTEENASLVGTEGCSRSTVKETYELILSDIDRAIELLEQTSVTPSDKRYVSKGVAYGIRARVNLTMQNWADAARDAQSAIENSGAPYSSSDVSVPTFINSSDNAWMWGILVAETDRVVTSGIVNFPSHMGSLNYGYAEYCGGRQINKKLYNTIPDTDVRKGWWLDEDLYSPNLNTEQAAYMASDGYPAYTQVKYAPYNNEVGTSTNASDIPLMRVEEMYLIRAEGLAMSGSTSEAKSYLESFIRSYRDSNYSTTASSATDLQEEIYRQRRIELWGEGLSWFDIMRLNKDVDRRGAGYPSAVTIFNIPAGSDILLYRIPLSEIEANVQLSESDNNPAASLPTAVADN